MKMTVDGIRLENPTRMRAATQAADFILQNMVAPDGFYSVHFKGNTHVAAQLPDYAALGLAFIALRDYSDDARARAKLLDQAEAMATAVGAKFGAAEAGFRRTATLDGIAANRHRHADFAGLFG